ncbi:chaperone protein ClpD, chloroplastic isoform X2 [Macadamia integrifolia]|uniref:chaperone protein ClpD, chloroplastic isoform X2 n=1 Tax=Macadamia integrifolia TaxID=60698 RepID=UPI001C4ED947|nr:chaperone protein ClpD, chloroplastic isoform X2 [Macadamia integrifolia]
MEVTCSSPLSVVVHQMMDLSPLPTNYRWSKASVSIFSPDLSAKFKPSSDCHGRRRVPAVCPLPSYSPPSSSSTSSSSSSTFGISISRFISVTEPSHKAQRRLPMPISAVFERFTERAIKAVMFSQREAKALAKDMVFTQHLLLGLVAEDRSPDGFLGSGITIDKARDVVRSIWTDDATASNDSSLSPSSSTHIPFSISTKRVFEAAVEYSRSMGYNFIAPEHIAIGLFTVDDGSAGRVLKRLGANANHLAIVAVSRLQGELATDGREPSSAARRMRGKSSSGKTTISRPSKKRKEKSTLAQFCVDLTARASEGLVDPVIGRNSEIQRVVEILGRRTKNNPILLGEPGVGKTAIAEGLAICIANCDVPIFLLTKHIMSLDIGLLMAGAKERGELEARVTTLISEIQKAGNIILFIDEVHTIVGSGTVGRGSRGSGLDIANLLKPSLGRGKLQCIASTTVDEHRKHFEKDKALARRFQPVLISEPSQEDAVRVLLGLREKYESHHKCRFTMEAINAAVYLSARYIPDRYLPDKAIDLIDEAGSRACMDAFKRRKEQQTSILNKSPNDYWQEIRAVQAMHDMVLVNKMIYDYDASVIDDKGKLISDPLLPPTFDDDEPAVVGLDEIAAVTSLWSGIPVQQITVDERMLLVGLDEQLRKRVIGQDDAVVAISRAMKRSRIGLKDPDRPIAAMLFCGPTGVGKTELAKALAACCFGSEATMLRLDMSEYMEQHTVSKLIGSPPGYVGYGEGGMLTEAIRRRPFTVVLLDEIEKAHPDIFNILLQIFEDGHLTDSQGRRVSFKNALIVMTSNVGSTAIARGGSGSVGFLISDIGESSSYARMRALVMEELKAYFRPEFLNRIDDVVVFRPIEKTQMPEILDIMLKEVRGRLMSMGIGLEVSETIKERVCEQGYDRSYGVRPLRRAVTLLIEDLLSEALLEGDYKPGDTAVIDVDASGNPFVINHSRSDRSAHFDVDATSSKS